LDARWTQDNQAGRVAEVEGALVRLEAIVARLRAEIARKDDALIHQKRRIEELEKALEGSRRAAKRQAAPFSKGEPKPEPKPPGRKSGKAHGRHGHRAVPTGPPDRELDAPLPEHCPGCCGAVVHDRDECQWQVDVPEPKVVTTCLTVGIGHCADCGRRVQGHHDEQTSDALGAAASGVGPMAKSLASFLHYGMGLSFRRCAEVLGHLGLNVTAGAICQSSARSARTDLVPVHAELVKRVNAAPCITMDESGWRVEGWGEWLWVAATDSVTLCWVAEGRGFEQASEVIGTSYEGVLVRDGYVIYRQYAQATHQTCTSHLLRRCVEMESDLPKWARATPAEVKAILLEGLKARALPPAERRRAAETLAGRMADLCSQPQRHDANRRLIAHLVKESDALFTYLVRDGVDATNWRAETALRPCVVNRKTWGGNRTWRGARTQRIITSVIATARKNGVDAISYLAAKARSPDPGLAVLLG
jgi:transposase